MLEVNYMAGKRKLRIVFSVILSDAGEATRALEIANGIKDYCPDNYELDIIFLSNGSKFEQKVVYNGFKIHKCLPVLPGVGFRQDLKPTKTNLIGDMKLAGELLRGEVHAFMELKPDVVIHGFYPIASLARRMVNNPILGICYLPIPLQENIFASTLMKDIPDVIKPLTYLPLRLRRKIIKLIPKSLKMRAPIFKQSNIIKALDEFKWNKEPINNLFDMLRADLTIINDFKEFYKDDILPDNYKIVGPLYAPASNNIEIDKNILNIFNRENERLKIFCTLGSSGEKQCLFEVMKALNQGIGKNWSAVILAPEAVCPIDEAKAYAGSNPNIYLTDSFVPAPLVNSLADIVISHGGQGTIQTAIASGTPVVGFAMQPEQQINLDNIVIRGAGIRIPINRWSSHNIQSSVNRIIRKPSYRENMRTLKNILNSINGRKNSAFAIWDYMLKKLPK